MMHDQLPAIPTLILAAAAWATWFLGGSATRRARRRERRD